MIKNNSDDFPENRVEIFSKFHDTLFQSYEEALSGSSHVLTKMESYWEYFSTTFPQAHKVHKKIKKAKNIPQYHAAVTDILTQLEESIG
jgi:IS1 family transposase